MTKIFGGSTIGSSHTKTKEILIGKSNQDSYSIRTNDNIKVGILCDGCSENENSEFGSMLASNILSSEILHNLNNGQNIVDSISNSQYTLINEILNMGGYFENYIKYFMFTIMGIIEYNGFVYIISCGDGVFGYKQKNSNLNIHTIYPLDDNRPEYLGLNLINKDINNNIQFEKHFAVNDIEYSFIGSDGLTDFINLENECFPGKPKTSIKSVSDICTDSEFEKPNKITNYLKKINLDKTTINNNQLVYHSGKLRDDTTIIIWKNDTV